MKNKENLTVVELMNMVTSNLRELNEMKVSDENLSNAVKRSKATDSSIKTILDLVKYTDAATQHKKLKTKLLN